MRETVKILSALFFALNYFLAYRCKESKDMTGMVWSLFVCAFMIKLFFMV